MLPETIISIARETGWSYIGEPQKGLMSSFKKGKDRVNVYYTKMTVSTALEHPKHGKTQLYRKNVTETELRMIFQNPRVHTKKGYYSTNPSMFPGQRKKDEPFGPDKDGKKTFKAWIKGIFSM